MANRPCKPDADFKRLWQILLPGTPVPACGVAEEREAKVAETTRPATDDGAERKS